MEMPRIETVSLHWNRSGLRARVAVSAISTRPSTGTTPHTAPCLSCRVSSRRRNRYFQACEGHLSLRPGVATYWGPRHADTTDAKRLPKCVAETYAAYADAGAAVLSKQAYHTRATLLAPAQNRGAPDKRYAL